MADKVITDPKADRQLHLDSRALKRASTKNAADSEPGVGVTDAIMDLLCHFIGNGMILSFINVMFYVRSIKK